METVRLHTDRDDVETIVAALAGDYDSQQAIAEGLAYLWDRGEWNKLAELIADIRSVLLETAEREAVEAKIFSLINWATAGQPERLLALVDGCEQPQAETEKLRRLEAVSRLCERVAEQFAENPAMDDLRADVAALAWELTLDHGDRWPHRTVMRVAFRRVSEGRHMERSVSIDHPTRGKPSGIDPDELFSVSADPARVVACRLDFDAWFEAIPRKYRDVAEMLYLGESIPMIAHKTGQTDQGVRIIRRTLEAHFRRFMRTRKREPTAA